MIFWKKTLRSGKHGISLLWVDGGKNTLQFQSSPIVSSDQARNYVNSHKQQFAETISEE